MGLIIFIFIYSLVILCVFSMGGISVDTCVIALAIMFATISICIGLYKIARILSNNDTNDKKE